VPPYVGGALPACASSGFTGRHLSDQFLSGESIQFRRHPQRNRNRICLRSDLITSTATPATMACSQSSGDGQRPTFAYELHFAKALSDLFAENEALRQLHDAAQ
jgi:hypothetical protein